MASVAVTGQADLTDAQCRASAAVAESSASSQGRRRCTRLIVAGTDGLLELSGVAPVIDERGVTLTDGSYLPTAVADTQLATKLKIPVGYLKWLREQQRTDLDDANVNQPVAWPRRSPLAG
ncbi:hypothetical protein [Nocardia salmonicida]|uniref:hypothetical protein n=1 Tax=Nocardia salmonicida TaxID=53431 RepID=UPI002E2C0A1A|nr:hypothetical protein [Nocardia salmonicida]